MCLKTKRFFSKKFATKDIIVYKHLKKDDTEFITPYRDVKVNIPSIVTSTLKRERIKGYCKFGEALISKGIHSFKLKQECIEDALEEGSVYIAECIIPGGSFYYAGTFEERDAYASNRLKYVSIIETLE